LDIFYCPNNQCGNKKALREFQKCFECGTLAQPFGYMATVKLLGEKEKFKNAGIPTVRQNQLAIPPPSSENAAKISSTNLTGKDRLAPFGIYKIICPHCRTYGDLEVKRDYTENVCLNCGLSYRVLTATVRAKRGRKESTSRIYIIRVITCSGEKVIAFEDRGCSDIDLRSHDIVCFSYKKLDGGQYEDEPSIVKNVTTNQVAFIKHRTGGFKIGSTRIYFS
jgi:hypothetical protein